MAMKFHLMNEHLHAKNTINKLLLLTLILIILTIIPLYLSNHSSLSWLLAPENNAKSMASLDNKCNIFRGKWVLDPNNGPYYTNATCREISDQQNCMKFGRPDNEFLKWRWKPEGCDLALFDANRFLELVRGKSMAFVGDSVGRNQMQSLLCLLAKVVYPIDVSHSSNPQSKRWLYPDHNFTLASFWSPHLVKAINAEPNGPTFNRLKNLYLDEANNEWASEIESFDYVLISVGRWFFGPQIYYENGQVVGCYLCQKNNIKNLTMFHGYKKDFRTTFKTLQGLEKFKGITLLRTLSPAHFENGEWNNGGSCARTRPVLDQEMKLEGADLELYLTQVEEFMRAEREGRKRGLKFRLLNISEVMLVRPDGHPNHYGRLPHENVTMADCVHWCLPGPIDTWNEFLLHMLKMDGTSY